MPADYGKLIQDAYHRAHPPGRGVLRELGQDKVWTPSDADPTPLEDLTPKHQRNLLAWLERNAETIELFYSAAEARGMPDESCFNEAEMEARGRDPLAWLRTQPLVKRLAELVAAQK